MSQGTDTFDPVQESNMTLMEHLIELRTRLIWIAGALVIGTAWLYFRPLIGASIVGAGILIAIVVLGIGKSKAGKAAGRPQDTAPASTQ